MSKNKIEVKSFEIELVVGAQLHVRTHTHTAL